MFCSDLEVRKSRKVHRCTSCGEFIEKGEQYCYWTNVDSEWVANKMHMECYEMHTEDSDGHSWDYMPYSYERPEASP